MELEYILMSTPRVSINIFALHPNASSFGSWTMRDGGIADRRLPAGGKGRYLYVGLETKPWRLQWRTALPIAAPVHSAAGRVPSRSIGRIAARPTSWHLLRRLLLGIDGA